MSLSLSEISIRLVGLGANHATSMCTWISNTAVLLPGSNRTCKHKNWTSASKGAMIRLLWDAVMIFGFCFRLPESTLRICFFLYFFVGCVIPIVRQKVNTCSFLFWVISGFCKASPKSTFEFDGFLAIWFDRLCSEPNLAGQIWFGASFYGLCLILIPAEVVSTHRGTYATCVT